VSDPLFYPYQRSWVSNDRRFKVGMFARQTGKTFTTTFEVANDCQLAELEGRRARWVILSRGERQAKEAVEEGVKRHCQAMGSVIRAYEKDYRGEATFRALEVEWPGGSRITALPANPDTARGFSANVFLDEFAFHQDSRKIWAALFPVISAGHKIRVVSTPNGKGNKFYDLMTAGDDLWYRQTTDIYQAVEDGLPRNIEELRTGLGDPDAWAQEYELQWLDQASAWLDYDLICSCEDESAGRPELYAGGKCYAGMDIGIRRDLAVIWVDELVGDVLWNREMVRMRRATFAEQDAELNRIIDNYNIQRLCMDQTGMGEKPVEDAKRRYGEYRVEGVLFTGPVKLDLATVLKQKFQDRKKRIPVEQDIRNSHHAVKKIVTAAGNARFDADRSEKGHADEFWADALATHAAGNPVGPVEYRSLNKRRFNKPGAWG
jgi:phage FluMu gp28-like protein